MNLVKVNSFMYSPAAAYTWRLSKETDLVARVPDELINSVVYFYPSAEDAKNGTKAGGTGFLVGVQSKVVPNSFYYMYVVTNRHIIGEEEANALVMRVNTKDGKFGGLTTLRRQWHPHPYGDDVAVCPITVFSDFDIDFVPDSMFLTAEEVREFDIGPGDDVALIGRFIHHEGRERNLPAVRFGNIAMMPDEPIETPNGIMQESYLVEMHSISGFSGSPAFVERRIPDFVKIKPDNKPVLTMTTKYRLLGVDWGHINITEPVIRYDKKKSKTVKHSHGWKVQSNSAMMGVVPIWKVMDILNNGQLAEKRAKDEKILKDEMDKAKKAKKRSMPDTSFSEDSAQLTEAEFKDVLKRVTRKTEEQWKRDNPHLTKASESHKPKRK